MSVCSVALEDLSPALVWALPVTQKLVYSAKIRYWIPDYETYFLGLGAAVRIGWYAGV